jgi:hypothetical protein
MEERRRRSSPALKPIEGPTMIIGLGIFSVLAIIVIYAFIKVKQRDREYERGE